MMEFGFARGGERLPRPSGPSTRCNIPVKPRPQDDDKRDPEGPTLRWGLDINAEGEKRKRVFRSGFHTKADAQSDRHDYLRELDGRTAVEQYVDTFGGFLDSWLAGRAVTELKATTIDSYRRSIDWHVIPVLGHRRIQTLRTQDLDALHRGIIDGIDGQAAVSTRTTR
jgi:hypothetical protein